MTLDAATTFPENEYALEAAVKGKFLIRSCLACGRAHHYPRANCPFCSSDRAEWRAASGSGTVYSFSVNLHGSSPSVIAYVELAEGPAILTNIVDVDPKNVMIGQPVEMVYRPGELTPAFRPSQA